MATEHRLFLVKPGSDEAGMGSPINSLCIQGFLLRELIAKDDYVVVLLEKSDPPRPMTGLDMIAAGMPKPERCMCGHLRKDHEHSSGVCRGLGRWHPDPRHPEGGSLSNTNTCDSRCAAYIPRQP